MGMLMTTLAQTPSAIRFHQLNEQNGLSNNHITAIIKDSTGFLWYGTSAGLNRYDGAQMKIFRHSNTDPSSLKDNNISDLFLGPEQKIWVRTRNGFCIYQPQKENFIRNVDSLLNTYQLPPGNISQIVKDNQNNYWFLHESLGLYRYNPQQKQCIPYQAKGNFLITGMALSPGNQLQIVYNNGLLEQLDCATLLVSKVINLFQPSTAPCETANYKVFVDKDGDLWIYALDIPVGVYYVKNGASTFRHMHKSDGVIPINTDMVTNITEDEKGNIWLATDHGGINLVDKKTFRVSYLLHQDTDNYSLAQNSTTALYRDDQQIIWVGTYKQGVSYYHKQLLMFPLVDHKSGLPFDDVNRFVEDKSGNLWIGSNGGGLVYYNRSENSFVSYHYQPNNPNSISSDIIVSMLLDKQNKLWIGTYHGGLNVYDGRSFKRYPLEPTDSQTPIDNSIWEIYQDRKNNIWIGTLSKGLYHYNAEKDDFSHLKDPNIPKYISAIMEDQVGNLWVGSAEGLVVLDPAGRLIQKHVAGNKNTNLSNNYISDILQDHTGDIWIATQEGLNLYLQNEKRFVSYRESDGLSSNVILNLLLDKQGRLWASTLKGLSCITRPHPSEKLLDIRNYDTRDGLQGLSFNENAALKTKRGELIFGGPGGFNIIVPENIPKIKNQFRPAITEFALFNRPIEIGKSYDGKTILETSPTTTSTLSLRYNQNVFSVTFSPFHYLAREQNRFLYKLEGFHEDWLPDEGNHKITFTNLDPGVYNFMLKSSIENGKWSSPYRLLRITIAPPFWKTPLAYLSYGAFILGILLLVRRIEKKRQISRHLLQQEREETKRTVELDRIKTRFFTNVSHEFRTPISLIMAPIDRLIEEQPTKQQLVHLETMKRNAKRLLHLVNQLLDLKKVDSHQLKLDLHLGDVIALLQENVDSFHDLAVKKNIHLLFSANRDSLYTYFDSEKLERIIFNLLSNAFKFTPENGTVSVSAMFMQDHQAAEILIKVADTGIGIPKKQQPLVFERYFQNTLNGSLSSRGNGIGLSITQEYVQLLGGTIRLESDEGKGSIFTVHLPLPYDDKDGLSTANHDKIAHAAQKSTLTHFAMKGVPNILLVDDDDELIFYLQENLKHKFHIEHCQEAYTAWQKVLSLHPDLVLSDIHMPGDSGIDLCQKIRKDSRTQHIPVILLTAYSDAETQITATNTGASDYITKPFHFQLLLSKIENQLNQKARFEKTYKKQLELLPTNEVVESEDEKFLRKAAKIAEENITNISFSVEDLAAKLNISRVGLYKRLLALNGHTPSEFIRNIRLRKAALLLAKSNLSIAEIAYQVGFNNPKQFSKYFKAMYHVLPSTYKQSQ